MNKKTIKFAGLALGMAMAVAGIGAAISASQIQELSPISVYAAEDDVHDMGKSQSTGLNDSASIPSITISNPGYPIKNIIINWRYNKDTANVVTIEVTIGGVSIGTKKVGTKTTADAVFDNDDGEAGDIVISFTNHAGSGTGKGTFYVNSVKITEGPAAAIENPITEITDVALSIDEVPLNYKETITVTATFAPGDTDELIQWSSFDEDVATIEASSENGVAVVTLVGEGETYFTASNGDGSISFDSDVFKVTEAVAPKVYETTFAGTGTDNDGSTALTTTTLPGKMNGDTLVVSSTSYVYNGANSTIKLSSKDNGGSMTVKAGEGVQIKEVILEAKSYGSDASVLEVSVGSSKKTLSTTASSDDLKLTTGFKYFVLDYASAAETISISATKRSYVRNITLVVDSNTAEEGAYGFGATLLNKTAEGCSELSASKLETAWGTLGIAYTTMNSSFAGSADLLASATPSESGDILQKAAARYDYIVGKYLVSLKQAAFEDFAGRDPAAVSGVGVSNFMTKDHENTALIFVTAISLTAALAGGLFFISRRRKEN